MSRDPGTPTTGPVLLDIYEFQKSGLLQEVNRQFFHPLGLALAVEWNDSGEDTQMHLYGIWDDRATDDEGYVFGEFSESDIARGKTIVAEQKRRLALREERLGFGVEPLQ